MDKTNQKILTVAFLIVACLVGLSAHLLMIAFAGAFGWISRLTDSDFVRHGMPVLIAAGLFAYLFMNRVVKTWGEEVVVEIRKVVWPSQRDTTAMTVVVIVMVFISAILITVFDFASHWSVAKVIEIFR